MTRPGGLAGRLLSAQVVIVGITIACLEATAAVVAPTLFADHLPMAGVTDPLVMEHAREAFRWSLTVSLVVAAVAALGAAGLLSVLLARRVGRPIEDLALAAESVAAGDYRVRLPEGVAGRELDALVSSFGVMAARLADADAARGRVMADLAHELRTPLATLEAQVDALEDGILAPDAESFESMRAQLSRLRRLAQDLRQVADIHDAGPELSFDPARVTELVTEAVAGAGPRYSARRVSLAAAEEADPGSVVLVDRDRIQQVFGNLLDNALRHTPAGGQVTVRTRSTPATVTIDVIDNGEGIDPVDLDRVFDRLHRGDPARTRIRGEGSGLGLTIARAIVIGHDGSLTAASPGPGRGATFTVVLPRHSPDDRARTPAV